MNTRTFQHTTHTGLVIDVEREDLNVLQEEDFSVRLVQDTFSTGGDRKRTVLGGTIETQGEVRIGTNQIDTLIKYLEFVKSKLE